MYSQKTNLQIKRVKMMKLVRTSRDDILKFEEINREK